MFGFKPKEQKTEAEDDKPSPTSESKPAYTPTPEETETAAEHIRSWGSQKQLEIISYTPEGLPASLHQTLKEKGPITLTRNILQSLINTTEKVSQSPTRFRNFLSCNTVSWLLKFKNDLQDTPQDQNATEKVKNLNQHGWNGNKEKCVSAFRETTPMKGRKGGFFLEGQTLEGSEEETTYAAIKLLIKLLHESGKISPGQADQLLIIGTNGITGKLINLCDEKGELLPKGKIITTIKDAKTKACRNTNTADIKTLKRLTHDLSNDKTRQLAQDQSISQLEALGKLQQEIGLLNTESIKDIKNFESQMGRIAIVADYNLHSSNPPSADETGWKNNFAVKLNFREKNTKEPIKQIMHFHHNHFNGQEAKQFFLNTRTKAIKTSKENRSYPPSKIPPAETTDFTLNKHTLSILNRQYQEHQDNLPSLTPSRLDTDPINVPHLNEQQNTKLSQEIKREIEHILETPAANGIPLKQGIYNRIRTEIAILKGASQLPPELKNKTTPELEEVYYQGFLCNLSYISPATYNLLLEERTNTFFDSPNITVAAHKNGLALYLLASDRSKPLFTQNKSGKLTINIQTASRFILENWIKLQNSKDGFGDVSHTAFSVGHGTRMDTGIELLGKAIGGSPHEAKKNLTDTASFSSNMSLNKKEKESLKQLKEQTSIDIDLEDITFTGTSYYSQSNNFFADKLVSTLNTEINDDDPNEKALDNLVRILYLHIETLKSEGKDEQINTLIESIIRPPKGSPPPGLTQMTQTLTSRLRQLRPEQQDRDLIKQALANTGYDQKSNIIVSLANAPKFILSSIQSSSENQKKYLLNLVRLSPRTFVDTVLSHETYLQNILTDLKIVDRLQKQYTNFINTNIQFAHQAFSNFTETA